MLWLITLNAADLVAAGRRATTAHAAPGVHLVEAVGAAGHEVKVTMAHSATPVTATPTDATDARPEEARPGYSAARPARNVLYLVFDDLRPDLSFYGAGWMRTPHLQVG